MNLIALNIDSIPLGLPLPFALRGPNGVLLAQKGYVITNRKELERILSLSLSLWIDVDESRETRQAYLGHLQKMLLSDNPLGEMASTQMTADALMSPAPKSDEKSDWLELQLRATKLLRTPQVGDFVDRFKPLHEALVRYCVQAPDAALLALIYLSAQETGMYSATHAMLVSCVCMIVAREILRWPDVRILQAGRAALSMNIAMTALQDQLAQQSQPLTAAQIAAIEDHAARSEALLRQLGVADPVWLEAVRCHHQRSNGPLASRTETGQLARLIQRVDLFAARIAPRATRTPMPVTAAMQASYYDEDRQVDDTGAAIVKALGIYPPGAFVRLASQEVAVVLRRGAKASTPRVAVVINRSGLPTGEPIPRDTAQPAWKITGTVAHKDVRVKLPLERLLALV